MQVSLLFLTEKKSGRDLITEYMTSMEHSDQSLPRCIWYFEKLETVYVILFRWCILYNPESSVKNKGDASVLFLNKVWLTFTYKVWKTWVIRSVTILSMHCIHLWLVRVGADWIWATYDGKEQNLEIDAGMLLLLTCVYLGETGDTIVDVEKKGRVMHMLTRQMLHRDFFIKVKSCQCDTWKHLNSTLVFFVFFV